MFTGFLDPLATGATALFFNPTNQSSSSENKISGDTWLQLIKHYGVTIIVSTPDIYNAILNAHHLNQYTIPSLRIAEFSRRSAGRNNPKEVAIYFSYADFYRIGYERDIHIYQHRKICSLQSKFDWKNSTRPTHHNLTY